MTTFLTYNNIHLLLIIYNVACWKTFYIEWNFLVKTDYALHFLNLKKYWFFETSINSIQHKNILRNTKGHLNKRTLKIKTDLTLKHHRWYEFLD